MHRDDLPDLRIEGWLAALGVESLCEWDVLVFLYRHRASLVSAEHIARLLGYSTSEAVAALESLEALGLVRRSRVSQGARLYQFAVPADPPRGEAVDRLMGVAASRTVRVLVTRKLRRSEGTGQSQGPSRLPPEEDDGPWLKLG